MTKLKIKILLVINFITIFSCSNSQIPINKIAERIIIVDMQAWINLMPGGPGSFHLTGEYEFDVKDYPKLVLSGIIVYADGQSIYKINSRQFSNELQTNNQNQHPKYRFNIQPGLKLNEQIRTSEMIDIELQFDYNGELIEKAIKNIYVTRAY